MSRYLDVLVRTDEIDFSVIRIIRGYVFGSPRNNRGNKESQDSVTAEPDLCYAITRPGTTITAAASMSWYGGF